MHFIPEDVQNYIYKLFFSTHILPFIKTFNQDRWMWRCTNQKKELCTERGAIQLGYTNNDGWSFIYLKNFLLCTDCTYNARCCNNCKKTYHTYIKS